MDKTDLQGAQQQDADGRCVDAHSEWDIHVDLAVKEFLKTAVVIDNEPELVTSPRAEMSGEIAADSGLGDEAATLEVPEPVVELSAHGLDVRGISDDFSSRGIACAFVLPNDADGNVAQKIERAVSASMVSDLVIIDWYLQPQDSSVTIKVVEEIARRDHGENGRLRLVCIYTGEVLSHGIFDDVKSAMLRGGISLADVPGQDFCAAGESTVVVMKNKTSTPVSLLPSELIRAFGYFADGLVPSFALAAVGAIRKSAHHMLTRFGAWLDPAYVANYTITNPREDVPQMIRELLVSECDSALGLERVADRFLDKRPVMGWLEAKKSQVTEQKKGDSIVDFSLLKEIVEGGVKDDKVFRGIDRDVQLLRERRWLISSSLAGSIEKSKQSEHEFARLVALKREAHGRSKVPSDEHWRPSLTTGSLVTYRPGAGADIEYLICLTPACDTLRLKEDAAFVFLRARVNAEKYGLVIREAGAVEKCLEIDSKRPFIRSFNFAPDNSMQRVLAGRENNSFVFCDVENAKFEWIGEIRYTRAVSEAAAMLGSWMRIGVSDSEYLRLSSLGKIGK
ncbi:hypothetical protein H9654_10975 [Stenotrophomonas sp. Sa5BUN4]|uniref:Response receiver domain-containing protein n=1 Tax=Stenotrophomonas lacuserhaii TaxID=2760084 RepID=A0A8X8FUR0_9GAMM|nr:response regulator receiver domain [Stenotrophomonas pennii]MBD7954719.1 hypothetical protein [Stenotrophomonas pennii]